MVHLIVYISENSNMDMNEIGNVSTRNKCNENMFMYEQTSCDHTDKVRQSNVAGVLALSRPYEIRTFEVMFETADDCPVPFFIFLDE